jgi:hypothetical protein
MSPTKVTTAILFILLTTAATQTLAQETADTKKALLTGNALIINTQSGGDGPAPQFDINVGGLLIVEIPDSGSRPPQNMSVKTGEAFERLGQLRGINTDKKSGRPLMGGGYTWFLFTPKTASKSETLEVKFTPNGGPAAAKSKTYKVAVTAK